MPPKIALLVIFLAAGLAAFYFEDSFFEPSMNDIAIKQLIAGLAEEGYEVAEIETTWLRPVKG